MNNMRYYSINRRSPFIDFREATIRGQAPDKGLYFPEQIPVFEQEWFSSLGKRSIPDIAFHVLRPYVGDTIPEEQLFRFLEETFSFPIPLVPVNGRIAALELFHGPTLAFKDIGARFMSRCLGYFMREETRKVTVLVATSGDTGGAVAHGFYDVPGIDVVILYPAGMVSPVQEKQLTTAGRNITALEIDGTFDDCQQIVKKAFLDETINTKLFLTSANSINVARWLPQQVYYFLGFRQWPHHEQPPVIAVPSGNFGNIGAGLLAMKSGLPVRHFIAACNTNDVVSDYLHSEKWQPRKVVPTFSNAMDVGDPSNFVRLLELVGNDTGDLKKIFSSCTISDAETLATIASVKSAYAYLLDPHGAVGYAALEQWLDQHPGTRGFFLETANPVKFPDAILNATGARVEMPSSLSALMNREKQAIFINGGYAAVKDFLVSRT